jgi:ubiquitin C-terminal hydrolase
LFAQIPLHRPSPGYLQTGLHRKIPVKIHLPAHIGHEMLHLGKKVPHRYQLDGVVAHSGELQQNKGHYIRFVNISGQWFRFDDDTIKPVQKNLPQTESTDPTAMMLLYVATK